jgi:hypothetical protein
MMISPHGGTIDTSSGRVTMKGVIFLLLMALLTFIPYGMQRYPLLATYLAPVKPFVFGAGVSQHLGRPDEASLLAKKDPVPDTVTRKKGSRDTVHGKEGTPVYVELLSPMRP